MKILNAAILALMFTMLPLSVMRAQTISQQSISDIAKSDPLIITGAVGTQNTYHYSSTGSTYGSPLSNTVYANLNISIYGFTMPFSFYYTNDNTSFSYPHISFNLNPSYKNWKGYVGQSSIAFSQYVMNMSFNGVGVEYNDKKLRFGAFYGKLRNAVNDDPTDPAARAPQYSRMGWGFKAGYGSGKNYIDLYLLRAYDKVNSINERWRDVVSPQENIVVGLKGSVAPVKWASLSANVATSLFSTDTRAEKVDVEAANKWDKVFDVRYSSLMRFAGDANLNLTFPFLSTSVSYRMVQPDYTSLGTYYMSNNYQSLGVTATTHLFKKIALSGNFSAQSDNLTNKQMYTTNGYIYSLNANTRIGNNFSISAGFNGYTQNQTNGTAVVNDTTRVNRQMSSYSLTPSYMIDGDVLGHNISVSANLSKNKDRNPFSKGESDVTTKALGLSYGMNVKPWEVDFTMSFSHQQTEGYKTKYRSEVGSLTASRSFLEEKNLNLSATASLCYNEVYRQSKNLSVGCDFSVGYTLNKVHVISAAAGFNKYGDVNMTKIHSDLDVTDITCSLNYTYTFTLLEIKRKSKE